MRSDKRLLALVGGLALVAACGGAEPDTDATTTPTPTAPEDTSPPVDTALASWTYVGAGTYADGAYAGTESYRFVGVPTQSVICDWAFDATGVPTAVAIPCADPFGNACAFSFDVTMTNGHEIDGD